MIEADLKKIARHYGARPPLKDFEWKPRVFPKYLAPIIVHSKKDEMQIASAIFGLIPHWEEGLRPTKVVHNARSETVHEKPMFKRLFSTSRCLIPMDSFFEWVPGEAGKKKLARFFPEDGSPLTAAGLYSVWESEDGSKWPNFTMLTKNPPKFIKDAGHDRCPYFLSDKSFADWINPEIHEADDLHELLKASGIRVSWAME